MTEREKILQKFCDESKTLGEAFAKMKEYDKAHNDISQKAYIDADTPEQDKERAEYFKKKYGK